MSKELEASLRLSLSGNIDTRAKQYSRDLDQMARRSNRSLGTMQRGMRGLGQGVQQIGNRYSAMLGGVATAASVRKVMQFDEQMERLGTNADISSEAVASLKKRLFEAAQHPDIRVEPAQILAAIDQVVEKTGDMEFAKNNIELFGQAISATGATGSAIGDIAAEFQKMGLLAKGDVQEAFNILIAQGKSGAFTMKDLASQGPKILAAYGGTGRGGLKAIREVGAALQVIRQGTGSSDQATTAFESLVSTLQDADKVRFLRGKGIRVFEPDQPEVMRAINELMADIIAKADGNVLRLSQVFDAQSMRALNASIAEFQRSGGTESLRKFYAVQAEGNLLQQDSARMANTTAAAVRNLSTAWDEFTNKKLSGPINKLADLLNNTSKNTVENTLDAGLAAGGLLGANWLTRNAQKAVGVKDPKNIGKLGITLGKKAAPLLGGFLSNPVGALTATGLASYYGTKKILSSEYMGKQNFYTTDTAHEIGEAIAKALAYMGNDNAQAALDAHLKITLDADGVKVTQDETSAVNVDVDAGGGF